jgi:hypothetical protein
MDREEAASRANGRVISKVMIALPRELDNAGRIDLTRDFIHAIGGDRVPWFFAIHQEGKDAHNPHAHIAIRDVDIETGKRVLRLSDSPRDRERDGLEPNAVNFVRRVWEDRANAALARAGVATRIDRRTLEAQGIEREPTIHIGPEAALIHRRVQEPTSRKRVTGRGREIDYPSIDNGRSRVDRNNEIIDRNLARDARSPLLETRVWAQFERGQRALDTRLEHVLAEQARKRTREERAQKAVFRTRWRDLKTARREDYHARVTEQRGTLTLRVRDLRERQGQERLALLREQTGFWARLCRAVDITGGTRRKHQATRRALAEKHKAERADLARASRACWMALKQGVAERFAPQEDHLCALRKSALSVLRDMHSRAETMADGKRQLRAMHREQERLRTEEMLRDLRAKARARDDAPKLTKPTSLGAPSASPKPSFDGLSKKLIDRTAPPKRRDLGRDRGPLRDR